MKIKVRRTDIYIPKWNGNEAESDPIKIHYRYLTAAERHDFIAVMPIKITNGEPEIILKQDNAGLVRKMVQRVENLEIEVDGKSILIDDGDKLYKTAGVPAELITEIEGMLAGASAQVNTDPLE